MKMISMLVTVQLWQAPDAKILEAALWSSYSTGERIITGNQYQRLTV